MTTLLTEKGIAEDYLRTMLRAEDTKDFDLWCSTWHKWSLGNFSNEIYQKDLQQMHEILGEFVGLEYLGSLKARDRPDQPDDIEEKHRFIFKVIYEKSESLNDVGILRIANKWYTFKNACHL